MWKSKEGVRRTASLGAGLGRPVFCTSHRRFLHEECDPFCIHTSIQSRNALSMRRLLLCVRGEGHVSVICTLFWNQSACELWFFCAAVSGLCLSLKGKSVTAKANTRDVNEVRLCYGPWSCFHWTDSSTTFFSQAFRSFIICLGQNLKQIFWSAETLSTL